MDAIMLNGVPATASILTGLDIVGQKTYPSNSENHWNYPSGAKYGLIYAYNKVCLPDAILFKTGVTGELQIGYIDSNNAERSTTVRTTGSYFSIDNYEIAIIWYG